MKLTDVIAVWNLLHIKDSGDIGFCDLEKAIDKVVGIENDVPSHCPCLSKSKFRLEHATIIELLAELTTRYEEIKMYEAIVRR